MQSLIEFTRLQRDGVYFVDPDRKITYVSQGAERMTGYTAKEALGKRWFDKFLTHMDDIDSPLCLMGYPLSLTVSDGERREAQVFLGDKQGHRVPVCVRVSAGHTDACDLVSNLPRNTV